MKFRSPAFSPRKRVVAQSGPGRTRPEFAEELDIHFLIKRFKGIKNVPMLMEQPIYVNMIGAPDFQTALDTVRNAEEAFMRLPARVREKFGNDPGRMLAAVSKRELTPAELKEFRECGLLKPESTPSPARSPKGSASPDPEVDDEGNQELPLQKKGGKKRAPSAPDPDDA